MQEPDMRGLRKLRLVVKGETEQGEANQRGEQTIAICTEGTDNITLPYEISGIELANSHGGMAAWLPASEANP